MSATSEALVVCAPSTLTNPYENKIDLITKEGITIWKTSIDPDKLLNRIALDFQNGDNFLARMKSKCSEVWLKKFIRIPTTGNRVPENLRVGHWNNIGKYMKLVYNYHELSEDQVTAVACYYWDGNDAQCVKFDTLVIVPLGFIMVDPELQLAKEKQQYCIHTDMIFQIIKIKSLINIWNCTWWNQIVFCLRIIWQEKELENELSS